jgi:dnd system-associated protein 4
MSNDSNAHSGKEVNWRTIGVKRERTFEALVSRVNNGKQPVFRYLKDLMVFAAIVGYCEGSRRPLSGDTIDIILDTYSTDQKDGFVYLLALLELKDANALRDANLASSVVIFEEYCNQGLHTIQSWLDSNPGDPDGIETLLNKTYEKLCETSVRVDQDPSSVSIL